MRNLFLLVSKLLSTLCTPRRVYPFILTRSQIVRLDRAEIEEIILTTHAEADQVRVLSLVYFSKKIYL